MTNPTTVGIVANPASARDIRRIVANGAAVTTHHKLNHLQRMMAGLAATGVQRVLSMADRGGIMAGFERLAGLESSRCWPALEFVDHPITGTEADTTAATQVMVDTGVRAIVILGGDGTNRVVASSSADVPLVSISTGTNNAFPQPAEPTVAGLAAGLVATDCRSRQASTYRAKKLVVRSGDRTEEALVDVAISDADGVGAGAVWDAGSISELFLCFAEADAIGLSAIGGHVQPTSRRVATGLRITLGMPAQAIVRAPIAPGLVTSVGVQSVTTVEADEPELVQERTGVIALDGERRLRFGPTTRPTVTLRTSGPVVVDVAAALEHASTNGLLMSAAPIERSTQISTTTGTNDPEGGAT